MPRACAFGCFNNGAIMHSFPNYNRFPERFKTWVKLVGGKMDTDADLEYYKKSKVCSLHFTQRDRNRFSRLNALAVPSLYLSGANTPIVQDDSKLDNGCTETNDVETDNEESPPADIDSKISEVITIPASSIMETDSIANDVCSSVDTEIPSLASRAVRREHTYIVVSKEAKAHIQTDRTVRCCSEQAKPLRMKIKYLRSEVSRLRNRCQIYKAKLAAIQRICGNTAVNEVVQNRKKPTHFPVTQSQSSKKVILVRTYSKLSSKGSQ